MEKRGLYYHLVMSQEKSDTTDTVSDHDDDTRSNMTAVNQVRKFSEPLKTESQPEKNTTKTDCAEYHRCGFVLAETSREYDRKVYLVTWPCSQGLPSISLPGKALRWRTPLTLLHPASGRSGRFWQPGQKTV